MDNAVNTRLETLLQQAQLLMSGPSVELQKVFTNICGLVLDEQVYRGLWDEPILSQLNWLFAVKPPAAAFGNQMAELQQRSQQVQRVNNFFFQVIISVLLTVWRLFVRLMTHPQKSSSPFWQPSGKIRG